MGDRNSKSEAVILVETRLGGAAKTASPLERRPEREDAGDCLFRLRESRGLAVEVNDGLRAFRSRNPSPLVLAWFSFRGLLTGDPPIALPKAG